jgi:MFS family permease
MNLYRIGYLIQGIWFTFVLSYLPVYLTNVHNFPAIEFSMLVLLGQSPMILKPIFGILADKYTFFHSPRRSYLLIGITIMVFGASGMIYILATNEFSSILVFFTCIYLGYTLANVISSAIVLDIDRERNYKIMGNLQFFGQLGNLGTMGLYLLLIGSNITSSNWFVFPTITAILSVLFFITAIGFKENAKESESAEKPPEPYPFPTNSELFCQFSVCIFIYTNVFGVFCHLKP